MDHMDAMEQMALDLEVAQRKRHEESGALMDPKAEEDFWDREEMIIFRTIKSFREHSRTYSPDKAEVYYRLNQKKLREGVRAKKEERILDLKQKGYSNVAIAKEVGMPESTVRRILKKASK